MIVAAERTPQGRYILTGTTNTFDELATDIADEISCELSSKANLAYLKNLYYKLVPEGLF